MTKDARSYLLRAQGKGMNAELTARAMTAAGFKVHFFGDHYKCGFITFHNGKRHVEFKL